MSPGGQMIDLVHIDDVVSAVLTTWTILEKEATGVHHIFAIRSGKPVTITDVLALLKMAAGFENADFIKPGVYPYRDRERFVLFENTPTPPGWTPNVGLFEGLKTVLEMRRIK
jgi:nucleoside-diphosphate-sugar epimerase